MKYDKEGETSARSEVKIARRRVLRTRVKCPDIKTDLGPTANQPFLVGRAVTLGKTSNSEVKLLLDGAVVGSLDTAIGEKVALAIDRGQAFTATIESASPIYNEKFKPTGANVDIKVEYLLQKDHPAIETEQCWRCVESTENHGGNGAEIEAAQIQIILHQGCRGDV